MGIRPGEMFALIILTFLAAYVLLLLVVSLMGSY